MALDLARTMTRGALDLVADQLQSLEDRAGRRAVRVSVAIPPSLDPTKTRDALAERLGRGRDAPPDIAIVSSLSPRSRPGLLTVDFELADAEEVEGETA